MDRPTLVVVTAPQPGAVAIIQLHGQGSRAILCRLAGRQQFDDDRLYLVRFSDVDEGMAVCRGEDWAQLMPHGGPRVVQKLTDKLAQLGAVFSPAPDAGALYPEASSPIEADMLAALASAPSPAAIDLLLAQPQLWGELMIAGEQKNRTAGKEARLIDDEAFLLSCSLDFLLSPPTVVVAGTPNVGKSTLTNAILGRRASLVAALPGTTRDWVGSLAEIGDVGSRMANGGYQNGFDREHLRLPTSHIRRAVAVYWIDTPGLRDSHDPIEREAIRLAEQVVRDADVLIAMRDPVSDYPKLPRDPDLRVLNKIDDARSTSTEELSGELPISALRDRNLDLLQHRVLHSLGLDAISPNSLWAFSPPLKQACAGEGADLRTYLGL
jgi:small GTP-binding protein